MSAVVDAMPDVGRYELAIDRLSKRLMDLLDAMGDAGTPAQEAELSRLQKMKRGLRPGDTEEVRRILSGLLLAAPPPSGNYTLAIDTIRGAIRTAVAAARVGGDWTEARRLADLKRTLYPNDTAAIERILAGDLS